MGLKEVIDVNFRGNIYIVQDGRVLFERENGFADLPNEISNTIETKYASASAGKVFVAVGILQLIEQGRIKFDDTLGMLLDIPLNDIDKNVTVKQLLNHTSGVPDYFDETIMDEYEELWIDHPIVNDIRNFLFGLAGASVYGSCKSRKQKFVMSFTIIIKSDITAICFRYL